jgi:hypothetical protein
MGVSLSYATTRAITSDMKARFRAEAAAMNATREWGNEAMNFFDDARVHGPMMGDTRFSPDAKNAVEDAQAIVEMLARWSKQYELTWALNLGGTDIGQISSGEVPGSLMGTLESGLSTKKAKPKKKRASRRPPARKGTKGSRKKS